MTPKIWSYGDVENEDVPVRDRPYESFGRQGYAMPDHAAEGERAPRGAERVELGERVEDPHAPLSDDRIRSEVSGLLTSEAAVDDLEVVVHHGAVAVTGTVSSESDRARAVHIAETVRGVIEVVPRIRLR